MFYPQTHLIGTTIEAYRNVLHFAGSLAKPLAVAKMSPQTSVCWFGI